MFKAIRPLLLILVVTLLCGHAYAESTEFKASDGTLTLTSEEPFKTFSNPHTVLSLRSEDESLVLVTTSEKRFDIGLFYEQFPTAIEEEIEDSLCLGRVMLSIDDEESAVFLIDGMFPPGQESTHRTLYAIANRGDVEYTFMIHFPLEHGDEGFEWAVALLDQFKWNDPIDK